MWEGLKFGGLSLSSKQNLNFNIYGKGRKVIRVY